ncbi:protein kinase [Rubinisphaera sp.]|uniref:protein kinase domain-containing protein n=1 Tax=Rubinisphaera sp. TaxID=2024857 RepID=UPI000C11CD89|nr:protein kinase [Rubinisphaera sp.]MBV09626.1 hypothetical protein [Rubinisphaera sp.]
MVASKKCPDKFVLQGFISGELEESAAENVSSHIETCSMCEETTAKLETDFRLLQGGFSQNNVAEQTSTLPAQIGPYRIESLLGRGGMGVVYRATHCHLEKQVALKVIAAGQAADAESRSRFQREMRSVGRFDHPNIVGAMDAGEVDGQCYLAMEFVNGCDISLLHQQNVAFAIPDACEIVRQAALGMQYIHEQGHIHRDLKPSNLILARSANETPPRAVVKILDLGLATTVERNDQITGAGMIVGTLEYASPEQVNHANTVDIRADIYSLGATLYKLLCGQTPLALCSGQSPIEKLTAICHIEPEPIQSLRPEVSEELAQLLHSMLEKSPSRRPGTPIEIADQLAEYAKEADLWKLIDQTQEISQKNHPLLQSTVKETAQKRGRISKWWLILTCFAFALFCGVIISIQTDKGTVTIEADPKIASQLEVTVLRNGEPSIEGWQINSERESHSIRTGNIELVLPAELRDKYIIKRQGNQIELRRGGEIVFTVLRKESAISEVELPPRVAESTPVEPQWSADLPQDGWMPRLSVLTPDNTAWGMGHRVSVHENYVEIDATAGFAEGAKSGLVQFYHSLPKLKQSTLGTLYAARAELEILNPVAHTARILMEAQEHFPQHWFQSVFGTPYDGSPGWMIAMGSTTEGEGTNYNNLKLIEPHNPGRVTMETVFLGDEIQTRVDGRFNVAAKSIPMWNPVKGLFSVYRWHVRVHRFEIRPLTAEEALSLKQLPVAPEYQPVNFQPTNWLEFKGNDDHVVTPSLPGDLGRFTVEGWFTFLQAQAGDENPREVFGWDQRANLHLANHGIYGYLSRLGLKGTFSTLNTGATPRHVAMTYDGDYLRLYLDGLCITKSDLRDSEFKEFPGPHKLHLGASLSKGLEQKSSFKGRVHAFHLTRNVVYTQNFAPPTTLQADADTVLLYDFSDGDGNILHDKSGHENHGTIVGPVWRSVQP